LFTLGLEILGYWCWIKRLLLGQKL